MTIKITLHNFSEVQGFEDRDRNWNSLDFYMITRRLVVTDMGWYILT